MEQSSEQMQRELCALLCQSRTDAPHVASDPSSKEFVAGSLGFVSYFARLHRIQAFILSCNIYVA